MCSDVAISTEEWAQLDPGGRHPPERRGVDLVAVRFLRSGRPFTLERTRDVYVFAFRRWCMARLDAARTSVRRFRRVGPRAGASADGSTDEELRDSQVVAVGTPVSGGPPHRSGRAR